VRRDGQDVAHGSGNDRVDYVTPFHLRLTPWVFNADPNAHRATIPPRKLSEYLLNPLHPVGGPKASWFLMLGYQTEVPELLAADLLEIVGSSDAFDSLPDSFGVKYVVRGVLRTPSGGLVPLQSIWMIKKRSDVPRLVSAYPARSQSDADQGT
jgi:hypothetical protein